MRPVRVEMRKWPDSPHWEFDSDFLGSDAHGHWLGLRRGTVMTRPRRRLVVAEDNVTVVPRSDWWVASYYGVGDPGRPFDTYVDVTTTAQWVGADRVRMIDLDLDVIKGPSGRVFVDDEDEFAEHRISLGYPEPVVRAALATCERMLAAVRAGSPPFDDATSAGWLARFRERLAAQR